MTPVGRIDVRALTLSFGEVGVLDRLELEVPAGAFVAVVGPSGCGKSTLLRAVAGLVDAETGAVEIDGQPVRGPSTASAWHPQRDLLLPWRRVLGNATLGAEVTGVGRPEAQRRALGLLVTFGLDGFERAWPHQLSGGMRQRLALLRTFLVPRPVLLLDEPLGALDAITRRDLQRWLEGVWTADRRTTVLVTHDVEEALVLADRVAVLSARPARVVETIEVDVTRPRQVTDPVMVAHKARLLDALARGRHTD